MYPPQISFYLISDNGMCLKSLILEVRGGGVTCPGLSVINSSLTHPLCPCTPSGDLMLV